MLVSKGSKSLDVRTKGTHHDVPRIERMRIVSALQLRQRVQVPTRNSPSWRVGKCRSGTQERVFLGPDALDIPFEKGRSSEIAVDVTVEVTQINWFVRLPFELSIFV